MKLTEQLKKELGEKKGDFKKQLKEASKEMGMTEKEVLKLWDAEKPHFGGSGPHRYEDVECVYCLRPENYTSESLKESFDTTKLNEAVSDEEKLKLIKGEFKNVLGSWIVDKATDEELLELIKLNAKRESAWAKHHKEIEPVNKKIDAIHRKYQDNGPCAVGY